MKRAMAEEARGRCTGTGIRPWSHCRSAHATCRLNGMRRMLITSLAVFMPPPPPAFASGKGGGGNPPPPPPAPVADPCDGYFNLPAYTDGTTPMVNRTNGGCVVVHAWLNG